MNGSSYAQCAALNISKPCSFYQLILNPWPRPGFPLPLRRNSWRRIQCDRFKNAYQVAPGQAWTIELWTWAVTIISNIRVLLQLIC